MKSILLVALFFLVTNWPTPSASWSLNQQYASMDPAQMGNLYAQQNAYDNQFGNGKLMNGAFRLNPDLFVSNDDRRAFSRTVGSNGARARKLSSTRFNLKPFDQIENDEAEFDATEFHERFDAPQQQQQIMHQDQQPQQQQQQQLQKDEPQTSITKLAQEAAKKLSEQKQDATNIKQDVKQDIKSTANAAAAPQNEKKDVKENTASTDDAKTIKIDQKAVAADQDQASKGEFIKPLNYKTPLRQQQFGNRPIVSQFQQQQPIFQQQQQPENIEQLRFQLGQADMVNTVDMNVLKNEAVRTMSYRNENQGQEVPLSGKYQQQPLSYYKDGARKQDNYRGTQGAYGGHGSQGGYGGSNAGSHLAHEIEKDAKRVLKGFDTISGTFSSLVIIANSNANSNLGVSSIDVDLLKSFLSTYFLGKSVEYVLKDADLGKLIEKFNEEHLKSYSTNSGSGGDKYDKYESTSKLSANIPVLSNEHEKTAPKEAQSSSSHSENTVVVKKEPQDADTVNLHHKNYYQHPKQHYIPGGGYYYMPHKKGGVIVINNLNDNINDRVRAILSGKDYNMSEYNSGLILPLAKDEIDNLMNDAIIVNNDNKNKNKY